jgi:UTP-glucose-1-phosphate uridylyltransferase
MGSRYGGLKQMDEFGPTGETIMDYSIFDAINAGFDKIIFVIRSSFKTEFEEFFKGKFDKRVEVHYVCQELEDLPAGFELPHGREKPWGTAHAVWACRHVVNEPFAVINADDFYGKGSFKTMYDYLSQIQDGDTQSYCTVSYYLKNTLSDHGVVNRGVCAVSPQGELSSVTERTKIQRMEDGRIAYNTESTPEYLEEDSLVSMNMWGFVPSFMDETTHMFSNFLKDKMNEEKSEFYIPEAIQQLMDEGKAHVKVMASEDQWFGVTYQEDKPFVQDAITRLIASGQYPLHLWPEK